MPSLKYKNGSGTWEDVSNTGLAATESTYGVIQLATRAETEAGTNDTKAVSPKNMHYVTDVLQSAIVAETNMRIAQDTSLANQIVAETTRATGVEGTLSSLNEGLTKTDLVSAINSENTRAKGVEEGLQTSVNTLTSGLSQEVSDRQSAVSSEETRAKGIEQGLRTDLDNHTSNTSNPHSVTKTQIGLSNVDNTSDADKPISTATQSALDGKVDKRNTANILYGTNYAQEQTAYGIASSSASPWSVVQRNGDGAIVIGTPTEDNHATTKQYVDAVDSRVTQEISDRETAVSSVQSNLDTTNTNLENEITRATTAEGLLQTSVNTLTDNLSAEVTRATGIESGLQTSINTINSKISTDASSTNKLVDKKYVDDSIAENTASFDGNWNTYALIPTTEAGFTSLGLPKPTNNNYLIVKEDETQDGGTWRYKYTPSSTTYNKSYWVAEYEINDTPFTQEQLDAINSTATTTKINQIATNTSSIGDLSTLTTSTKTSSIAAINELNSNKVDKVSSVSKVYGTDASGNQTTYDYTALGHVDDVKINGNSVVSSKIALLQTDGLTVTTDNNNKIQAEGLIEKNKSNKIYDWIGTESEYETAVQAGTIQSSWLCFITDDEQNEIQWGSIGGSILNQQDLIDYIAAQTLPSQAGNSGKFLTTDGTNMSWAVNTPVPNQTGQNGKYLKTNGSVMTWENIPNELPSQSGNTGKYLTTNGSTVSWASVDALPSQSGQSGKFLTTNGTSASWATINALQNTATGINSLTILGSSNSNAYSINIGNYSSVTENFSVAIGSGSSSTDATTANRNSVAIGYDAKATGTSSISIGTPSKATGTSSIQIGPGTNSEANSLYIGTSSSNNWKLLGSDGKIPDDRLNTTIARTSQIPTVTDTYSATSSDAMSGKAVASAISGKQNNLTEPQLNAVNSGINSSLVGQISTNETNIGLLDTQISQLGNTYQILANIEQSLSTSTTKYPSSNAVKTAIENIDALPSQSGQSGKFLTTNGTSASWATVDALPSQTSQSGKFLTTDGTDASWATINQLSATYDSTNERITFA